MCQPTSLSAHGRSRDTLMLYIAWLLVRMAIHSHPAVPTKPSFCGMWLRASPLVSRSQDMLVWAEKSETELPLVQMGELWLRAVRITPSFFGTWQLTSPLVSRSRDIVTMSTVLPSARMARCLHPAVLTTLSLCGISATSVPPQNLLHSQDTMVLLRVSLLVPMEKCLHPAATTKPSFCGMWRPVRPLVSSQTILIWCTV